MVTKVNNPVLDLINPAVNGALFSNDIEMGSNRIRNVVDPPSFDDEVVSKRYVDQLATTSGGGVFLPAGFGPVPWAADAPVPGGWLLCDGEEHDPVLFPDLVAVIGTTYNTGGETPGWFRVPDMRGAVPAGLDDMAGPLNIYNSFRGPAGNITNLAADALNSFFGAEDHQLTVGEMPLHSHIGSANTTGSHSHSGSTNSTGSHTHTIPLTTVDLDEVGAGANDPKLGPSAISTGSAGNHSHSVSTSSAGSHSHTISIGNAGSSGFHNNVQPTTFFAWIIRAVNATIDWPGVLNMGGNQIVNVADPTAPQGAATAAYVDAGDAAVMAYVDGKVTYDVAVFHGGNISTVGKEVTRFESPRNFTIPNNFTTSQTESRTVTAAPASFSIRINGGQIGTVDYAAGFSQGTFTGGGGPFNITVGQVLTIVALTADANQEDISIVIKAELT